MIAAKTVQATRSDVKTGPMYCDQWRRRGVAEGIFPLIVFMTQGGVELVEAGVAQMADDDRFKSRWWKDRVEAPRDEAGRLAELAAQATTLAIRQSLLSKAREHQARARAEAR